VRGHLAETLGRLLVTDVAGDAVHITRTLSTAWKPGVADLALVTATTGDVLLAATSSLASSSSSSSSSSSFVLVGCVVQR